jgi:hypothetical protein
MSKVEVTAWTLLIAGLAGVEVFMGIYLLS